MSTKKKLGVPQRLAARSGGVAHKVVKMDATQENPGQEERTPGTASVAVKETAKAIQVPWHNLGCLSDVRRK